MLAQFMDGLMLMLDRTFKFLFVFVFVLAVLVIAVKGLPGDSKVFIEWGAAAFCASVLLSIYISLHIGDPPAARISIDSAATGD